MAIAPFNCHRCNNETLRIISNPLVLGCHLVCRACADELAHSGSFRSFNAVALPAHPGERAVVWKHPQTGEVRYPPVNDAVIPKRYRDQGFERHELPNLRDLHRHERDHNVLSEAAHFDHGSGRGFDGD